MASPQRENGYTGVANEILEALARVQMSGHEWRIVMALFRETYGHQTKTDYISFAQWERLTGLPRRHVGAAIKRLEVRNVITINRNGHKNSYQFQKDYELWSGITGTENSTSTENDTSTDIGNENGTDIGNDIVTENGTTCIERKKEYIHGPEPTPGVVVGKQKTKPKTDKKPSGTGGTDHKEMFAAIAEVCAVDWKVATEKMKTRLNVTGKKLREAGYTPEQVRAFGVWWKTHDWRGKTGQVPTPEFLRDSIGQCRKSEVVF